MDDPSLDPFFYDPYGDEDDEANEEVPEALEEEKEVEYELPDNVPGAPPLAAIGEHSTDLLYETLVDLYNNAADESRVGELRAFLRASPDIAVALFQILHESGLAKAPGDEDDDEDEADDAAAPMLEVPAVEAPALPPGATSWLGKPRQRPNQ